MAHQPKGRSTLAPFLIHPDAEQIIAFVKAVFGATLIKAPIVKGTGGIWNAELAIGDSTLMVSSGDGQAINAFIHVYVPDADATHALAVAKGAEVFMPVADQFYGDRGGGVKDPWGNHWWIATHQKALSPEAVQAAAHAQEAKREQ